MKPIRWTNHALQSLADREIERSDHETVVVTLYKTSQINRYLKEVKP